MAQSWILPVLLFSSFALRTCHARVSTRGVGPEPNPGLGQFINQTQYHGHPGPVEVAISTKSGERNQTAPLLYGWMFEELSHSGDGGLYGEMIVNRAFQGSGASIGMTPGIPGSNIRTADNPILPFGPVSTGWRGIGGTELSLTILHPLSEALPVVMEVDIPWDATGEVGILNEGWWGMDIRPGTYNSSFYILRDSARGNGTLTSINLSLRSNLTDDIWCSTNVDLTNTNISDFYWTQYEAELVNEAMAPNSNNTFALTMNASEVAGDTFYFGLVSLFPETFKGRKNGLRRDLADAIYDLGAKFLRFPGGNNIEGYSIESHWNWTETIGPLRDRKSRVGNWGYVNTNGLGLLEYLEWCEDMEMEPVLAVYSGFSVTIYGQAGPSYPEAAMGELVQDVLNELEYCMGDTSTKYGALRAEHGHLEPFTINYVELGNEDFFSTTYDYRFPILYKGIKAVYPNITLISTEYNENGPNVTISIPAGGMWDTHHYVEPSYFEESFDLFDNPDPGLSDVTIFVGEYSVFQYDTPDGSLNFSYPPGEHIFWPNLLSAIGESVYLLGIERNPNVVKMTSYAPSFVNLNWIEWTPDLVGFTANYDETILSSSWYLQWLYNHHRGTETLPVTTKSGDFNPLWWVATIDTDLDAIYFKVTNSGNSSIPLMIDLDTSYTSVNGTILTAASLQSFNYVNNMTEVYPAPITNLPAPSQDGAPYQWAVPAFSINVLQFNL